MKEKLYRSKKIYINPPKELHSGEELGTSASMVNLGVDEEVSWFSGPSLIRSI